MFDLTPSDFNVTIDYDLEEANARRRISNIKVPDSFDLKKNKKKYCLHQVEFPGTWQVDLLFSKNNCFFIAIEVNTRYVYAVRTNIYHPGTDERTKKPVMKVEKKTKTAIAKAMLKLMLKGWNPSLIISDGEKALKSKDMEKYIYKKKNIQHIIVPMVTDDMGNRTANHTSLGIIDRLTRTLKRWVYDRGWARDIIPFTEVDKFVEAYNNRNHSTLNKIFNQPTTPKEVHDDMEKEMYVIKYLLRKNKEIRQKNPGIEIPNDTLVKVYNQANSFGKRIRISRPDPYKVIGHYGNIYDIENTVTGKIEKAPRIWLEIL